MGIAKGPTHAGSYYTTNYSLHSKFGDGECEGFFCFIDLYTHQYLGLYSLVQFPIELGHHTIADVLGHRLFLHQMDNILHKESTHKNGRYHSKSSLLFV